MSKMSILQHDALFEIVILSGAKDLPQTLLITPTNLRDPGFDCEISGIRSK